MVSELYRKNGAGGAGEAGEVFQAEGMYVKHLKQELDGLMLRPSKEVGAAGA